MSFEERYFSNLLASIKITQNAILQISNYMVYFRENWEKIIEIWFENFLHFNQHPETQILYIYVASEAIQKSSLKGKLEYVKGFGDKLIEVFREIVNKCNQNEILLNLLKVCDCWENSLIYARNFMDILRKIVNTKLTDDENKKEKSKESNFADKENSSLNKKNKIMTDLKLISKNEFCKTNFELDIEEDNIKSMNEKIDRDRLTNIMEAVNYNDLSKEKKDELKEIEEKLKDLRKLLLIDISKRENFVIRLGDFISNEKKAFLNCHQILYELEKKKDNPNQIRITNNNNINSNL